LLRVRGIAEENERRRKSDEHTAQRANWGHVIPPYGHCTLTTTLSIAGRGGDRRADWSCAACSLYHYSTRMFASLTIFLYLSISLRTNRANSSGVLERGISP